MTRTGGITSQAELALQTGVSSATHADSRGVFRKPSLHGMATAFDGGRTGHDERGYPPCDF